MAETGDLVGIEYHGIAGVTQDCLAAVRRLMLSPGYIERALILTCLDAKHADHCLILYTYIGDTIAIKSGFASGYGGEGPSGFSCTLALLDKHKVELDEIEVDRALIERLDASALTRADMDEIAAAQRRRPRELWDYIYEDDLSPFEQKNIWRRWDPEIPMQIIDDRLLDLALTFWSDPDSALWKAHRRLETIVRDRIGAAGDPNAKGGGARVFNDAFLGEAAKLTWKGIGYAERQGRANLFIAAVGAHRNARAHREVDASPSALVSEFLLINHLYQLENDAVESEAADEDAG